MSTAVERVSGRCARCQTHTRDGVSRSVETGSGPGAILVLCADTTACLKRAPKNPYRSPS
ncbi:hypothetical protein [Actinacidiphila glaucinigra]|uniref:hypothetical protein n=1 Tax=Actinacidiphila glaucinigra TaxID=235986 RepID=UPI0035DF1FE7